MSAAPQLQPWPFAGLTPLSYDVILADPPWRFDNYSSAGQKKAPARHYATMGFDDLASLPVAQLGRGDALLFMWCCWPTIDRAIGVMKAWGFDFKTGGAWHKRTNSGKTVFGTGYILRSATEPYLIGTLGAPATSRSVRGVIETVIDAERREHSRKPDEQYGYLEQLVPNAMRRCELFARETRPGWDSWGNELHKFDTPHSNGGGEAREQ